MTPSLHIERAGLAQLDEAAELFQGYLRFYGKCHDQARSRAFVEARLDLRDSVFLLAWDSKRALGFAHLYPTYASLALAPSWILNDLFVAPDARSRGVATALLEAARTMAVHNGAVEIVLQTARSNDQARSLYERLGYVLDEQFLVYALPLPHD